MKNRFETLKFLLTDGNLTIQRNDHPLIPPPLFPLK